MNEKLSLSLAQHGLEMANPMQKAVFGTLKSGADTVILAPKNAGKTTTMVMLVIQQLTAAFEDSPRALIVVPDKERLLHMEALFNQYAKHTDLRVFATHEKTDMDGDKYEISCGIDVLIGTPKRLSDMFSSAGYNVNKLHMWIMDEVDEIAKNRQEHLLDRLSISISKVQRIMCLNEYHERAVAMADRVAPDANWFDFEEEED